MVAPAKTLKWAITGATGQLGRELVTIFKKLDYEYISWSSSDLDIASEGAISKVTSEAPDLLINCAAWTAVDKAESEVAAAFRVNELGAANMARAANRLGIPLVHISTDYVFAGNRNTPWKVEDPTEPTSAYGRSKLAGEVAIRSIHQEGSYILRTAWLYSAFGSNFAKSIISKTLNTKEALRVVDDQIGQPTYAKDLARQIIDTCENKIPFGTYHATNSGSATWYEFASRIIELIGEPEERINPVTSNEFPSPVKRPNYSVLDNSKWLETKVPPMRDWKEALDEAFPSILASVRAESVDA